MAPVDLRLRALIDSKQINDLPKVVLAAQDKANKDSIKLAQDHEAQQEAIRKRFADSAGANLRRYGEMEQTTNSKRAADYEKLWQGLLATEDKSQKAKAALQRASVMTEDGLQAKRAADYEKLDRQKYALQRASISLEEGFQTKRIAQNEAAANKIARAEYDLAHAQASITTERFERLRLIEDAQYELRRVRAGENDRLLELEAERHSAKMNAITAQEGAFSGTPFQKLLGHLGTLTGRKTNEVRESGEAALGLFGLEAEGPGMAAGGAGIAGAEGGAGLAALGGPAALAATVAVGALAVGLFEAVKAGKEMRESQEAVESSLKASGREETLGAERLSEYAAALANSTKFSNNQARAAEGMLLPFRHISDEEIPKLLAVSADLAAKMGISLPEAATKLGLAFENPEKGVKALRAAHVVLGAEELAQIKSWENMGESGKAHALLFTKLEESLGHYATDTVHNTEILGNRWEELSGKIGTAVLKIGDSIAGLIIKDKAAREFQEKLLAGDFSNYADKVQAGTAKAGSAMDLLQKQFEETAKKQKDLLDLKSTAPEMEPIETDAQLKNQDKIHLELLRATAKSAGDQTAILIAEEKIRYDEQRDTAEVANRGLEDIEKLHRVLVSKIVSDGEDRNAKEIAKSEAEQERATHTRLQKQFDAVKREMDRKAALVKKQNEEEKKHLAASESLAGVKGQDPFVKLEAQHQKELKEYEGFKEDQAKIDEKYRLLKQNLETNLREVEVSSTGKALSAIGGLMQQAAGKNKAIAKAGMVVTEAGAIANMAAGIMHAWGDEGNGNFYTRLAESVFIGATGATQIASINSQMSKFAGGTDYAPGGMALVGELGPEMVYLPRGAQVKTASETKGIMGGRGESSHTTTIHAPVNIQLSGTATPADANRVADVVEARIKGLVDTEQAAAYRGGRRGRWGLG